MPKYEDLIQGIADFVDQSIDDFNSKIPSIQKDSYRKIELLLKELDVEGKRVLPTTKNIAILAKLKIELKKVIVSPEYKDAVDTFVKTYDKVDDLQQEYFSTINKKFKPSVVFKQVRKLALESVKEDLLGAGVQANVVDKGYNILLNSITNSQGVLFSDMTEQMRSFLLNDKQTDGSLARYAHQKAFDNLQQYNRRYAQFASDDLGLVFYQLVGPLKQTSREACIEMIAAKKNGCMKFIHVSQFDDILRGQICGKQLKLDKKTGLPLGFYPDTTVSNLVVRANGYECAHQYMPVSTAIVDELTRKRFKIT